MWLDDTRCVYAPCVRTEDQSSSDDEEVDISKVQPEGYEDGVLKEYMKNCNSKDGGTRVDCSRAIKVYVDVNPHELKKVDDQNEEFNMIFVLKLAWLDPDLKNFESEVTLRQTVSADEPHLTRKKILLKRKYANGDIDFVEHGTKHAQTLSKFDYVNLKDPDWSQHFFPDFSFLNMQNDALQTLEKRTLLWCGDEGGFVSYSMKYYATFQESLELHSFPLDRQLCRIKMTAEKLIDEFQFVPVTGVKKIAQVCDMWACDNSIQQKCTVYVRHCDRYFPYEAQRSCVSVIFHLERKGDYYFHSVLFMVFLVNIISLCTFSIHLEDVSGRLGHLSTCFLAVLAYRYVIDDTLPRKEYLTAADGYIIFACSFQVLICIQTVLLSFAASHFVLEHRFIVDRCVGLVLLIIWLGVNYYLHWLWRSATRQSWHSVYQANREPYGPFNQCSQCGRTWLIKQCQVSSPEMRCQNHPDCPGSGRDITTKYYTPEERQPLVKPQRFPSPPEELKQAKNLRPTAPELREPISSSPTSARMPLLAGRPNYMSSGLGSWR
ncbi:GLRA1 [Symbiodinium necroappetens]|uniref:GLRA1 protein n=1 Tax=Symbiodinium necroappetens TaxID=1628268 RepID=A0A813ACZ9_9DINO|nr:GLRA1 [Symbiodinium necroappetens]